MARFIVVANEVRRTRGKAGTSPAHWERMRQLPTFYVEAWNESEARSKVHDILRADDTRSPDRATPVAHSVTIMEEVTP